MDVDLHDHPYFTPWTDPVSGVVSHVLTRRVAPVQKHFYYTNRSVSPNPRRTLAVVSLDPSEPIQRHFPAAGVDAESPMIAPDSSGCYFTLGSDVWFQPIEGQPRHVFALPESFVHGRAVHRLATHLSLSADGQRFLLDGHIGTHWFIATAHRETGAFELIREFPVCHNHAQFSPVDPEVFTIAADQFNDPATGQQFHHDARIWLGDTRNEGFELVTPHVRCRPFVGICHEWWSADGKVCYIDYERGVYELDLATREHTQVWAQPLCHAHCSRDRRWWAADQSPYFWDRDPCQVLFYDRDADRVTPIAAGLPQPTVRRSLYHLDPHPQFSPDDRWVVYTTTALDAPDVALTPVAALVGG